MENQVIETKRSKAARFESYEAYQESASKTAKQVAFNRKENAILRWYGFGKSFSEYILPAYEIYMDIEKRRNFYVNECDCAITVLWAYLEGVIYEKEDLSTFGVIAKAITKTTQESFERWGDKNHIKEVRRAYISPDGIALDVQAQGIEYDYSLQVSENDFIEFILAYPKGAQHYENYAYLRDLSDKFKGMVGFPLDEVFAREFLQKMNLDKGKAEELKQVDECPF